MSMLAKLLIECLILSSFATLLAYGIKFKELQNARSWIFNLTKIENVELVIKVVWLFASIICIDFFAEIFNGFYIWWLMNLDPEQFKNSRGSYRNWDEN